MKEKESKKKKRAAAALEDTPANYTEWARPLVIGDLDEAGKCKDMFSVKAEINRRWMELNPAVKKIWLIDASKRGVGSTPEVDDSESSA